MNLPLWLRAVQAGRTFATNGPLVEFELAPAGPSGEPLAAPTAGPGQSLDTGPEATRTFVARVEITSLAPLDRIEILVNGDTARAIDARGRGRTFRVDERLEIPGSAWVAVMAVGPASRDVTDGYAFAHTSPVYVVRGGRGHADPAAARELADLVRGLWERVDRRDRFPDEAARARYLGAVERALEVYERIAATGRPPDPRP